MTREFFTVKEIATLRKVTEKTVRRWIDEGLLKATQFRPRGSVRVSGASLQRFDDSGRKRASK